jgi:hypothetical protein
MTEEKKKKWTFEDQLRITDRESCERAIRNGGVAALVSAGLTAVLAIAGFFVQSDDARLSGFLDPWLLADVVLIVIVAVFIFRRSRVASTLMFVYFVGSKILQVMDGAGASAGMIVAVFFALYFFTAMRGTYLWHSKYRHEAAPAAPA